MTNVYVEPSAMQEWKTSMKNINTECITSIDNVDKYIKQLESNFKGDFPTSYIDSFENFAKSVRNSHDSMSNLESFLDTVVEVMENQ